MLLSLFHDSPASELHFAEFQREKVWERLRAVDARARSEGTETLDPERDPLVAIGMETCGGRATRNGYGVFNLSWQAREHPEWAEMIGAEVEGIRRNIKDAHGVPPRFLIWAGMGGSAEDKIMYNATGLLKRGLRCYVLDSTDPAKLKYILDDMCRRSGLGLPAALRSTLVAGMAMGMTSFEPVLNMERLASLYSRHHIDSRPNFFYMTLPGSLLDEFAAARGYRKVELQPDGANTTAGRHSGPLTRGSLYPLALAKVDLRQWIAGTFLTGAQVHTAWRLAAFIHAQALEGRDKLTLLLPKPWSGAGLWTKQDFEESLGKREDLGLKVAVEKKARLADYRSPKDAAQDRCFLSVEIKGLPHPEKHKVSLLRRTGYPVAVLTFPAGSQLSTYMQFIHYVVFGLAWLRRMNFVTQPGVELYKTIANRLYREAGQAGGIERVKAWRAMRESPRQLKWRGSVTLHLDCLPAAGQPEERDAARLYAAILRKLACARQMEYGELTFFGDTRYSPSGRAMLKVLERAAGEIFRARLKMPADVYEGPAVNHSYHEMIIGHGRCLSTVLLSDKTEQLPAADCSADYHRAQFLATQMALRERGRPVVGITLKDMEEGTLEALGALFHQAAVSLKANRI